MRKAISLLFDFQWINQHMFFGMYKENYSYFINTEYAAIGIPQGDELKILKKYQKELPEELFLQEWQPCTKNYNLRKNLKYAKNLLEEAGWRIIEDKLVNENN